MSNEDDLFWQIALSHDTGATDTTWLVPNEEELVPDSNGPDPFRRSLSAKIASSATRAEERVYTVLFQELLLESGVMSRIGGEVWEASLLLCAYILLYRDRVVDHLARSAAGSASINVLELGSGVGLPGLLVALLLRGTTVENASTVSDITVSLTDFDDNLLENLCANGQLNGFIADSGDINRNTVTGVSAEDGPLCRLSIDYLNWFDFNKPVTLAGGSEVLVDTQVHRRGSVSLMFGSALVYSPSHAAVADVIEYFLGTASAEDAIRPEMTVIQIGDRAGVDYFTRRLEEVGLCWSVGEVPEECYRVASEGCTIEKYVASPAGDTTPSVVINSKNSGRTQKLTIDLSVVGTTTSTDTDSGFMRTPRESFRLFKVWK